jgi:hypothetical protein
MNEQKFEKKYDPIWKNKKGCATGVISRDDLPEFFKLLIFNNQYYEEGGNKPIMNYVIVDGDNQNGYKKPEYKQSQERNRANDVEYPDENGRDEKPAAITDTDVPF